MRSDHNLKEKGEGGGEGEREGRGGRGKGALEGMEGGGGEGKEPFHCSLIFLTFRFLF